MRSRVVHALAGVLLLGGLAACEKSPDLAKPTVAPAPAAAPASTAIAAQEQDFGPPQGEPVQAILTDAPEVPPPTHRTVPAKVIVSLEVKEVELPIADGATYTFWTFGGKVPGKFIRVRQGDTVEFHLRNAAGNKMPHNIDLHAVMGPGGGAAASFTAPGHESVFSFKALRAGLFNYHCATAPVGMHIANGMYGLILVEPPEGLPAVDREYYVMQGDFYTQGRYHDRGPQQFDMEKAIDERPTYVLFNGAEGALTGDRELHAKTGEKVRLFFGNGGPNLVSSFHVIGQVFDKVYDEGGLHFQEDVGTTLVPAGGAAILEFTTRVPGEYALVDHSIFRAFNKGALGMIKVEGPEDRFVYSGKQADGLINGENTLAVAAPTPAKAEPDDPYAHGKQIFSTVCAACHQQNAKGLPGTFPPLAGSDFLMADKKRAIGIVLHGLTGPVTVNGQQFNSQMPAQTQLSNEDIAAVLSFVRNSFGNKGEKVTPDEVAKIRNGKQTLTATH